MSAKPKYGLLVPFLTLAIFAILVFFRLDQTSIKKDEIEIADWALQKIQGVPIFPNPLFFAPDINLPGLTCFYTGTLNFYLIMPFIWLWGPTLLAVRIGIALVSCVGLLSIHYCLCFFLGRIPAAVGTLALATNTVFIFAARSGGESEEILTISMFWTGLALIIAHIRKRNLFLLTCAGFIWGLAMWSKLLTMVYIAGFLVCIPIFDRQLFSSLKKSLSGAATMFFASAFALGALPLINELIINRLRVPSNLLKSIAHPLTGIQASSNGLVPRIAARLSQLGMLLVQSDITNPDSRLEPVMPPLLPMLSIAMAIWYLLDRNRSFADTKKNFLTAGMLVCVMVFAALIFVPNAPAITNIIALMPFFSILTALSVWMAQNAKSHVTGKTLLVVLAMAGIQTATVQMEFYIRNIETCRRTLQYTANEGSPLVQAIRYIQKHDCAPLVTTGHKKCNILAAAWATGAVARDGTLLKKQRYLIEKKLPPDMNFFYILTDHEPELKLPPDFKTELVCRFEDKSAQTDDYAIYRISAKNTDMMNNYLESTELLYPLTCIKTQEKETAEEKQLLQKG